MKIFSKYFLLFSIFIIFIFVFDSCKKRSDNIIKIGANLPLTGELAVYGQNDKKGIDLALDDSQLKNKIKVIYADNKGTAKDGITAARKLLDQNVLAVIDDAISGITLATIPIYTKSEIPLISTGATNPSLSGISPYFFRVWNSDLEEGAFAANAAFSKLKYKNVVVLYLNSDYGVGLKNVFLNRFKSLGGNIVKEIAFDENIKDYRSIITKFKNSKYDLIYIIGYATQTGPLVKNIREQRILKPILSTVATEDKKFIDLAGKAANGVIYVFNATPSGDNYKKFVSSYKNKYNESPQLLTDVGYDAMKILLMAIKNGARTGKEIRNYLSNMETYEGASGVIKFDKNGDVHKPMILKTIKNGKFVNF